MSKQQKKVKGNKRSAWTEEKEEKVCVHLTTEQESTPVDQPEVGVNAETKDKNVKEFYEHVLQKFEGNRAFVRDYFRTLGMNEPFRLGFMHSCVLESLMNKKEDDNEFVDKLARLSRSWKANGIVEKTVNADEFLRDRMLRERYVNSFPVLKYFEQHGARFWKNKFALEMRGTVLFVNPENNAVKMLVMKLPRGAEAVTGMVVNAGGETQDVKKGQIGILDLEQQDTCIRLCKNQDMNMYLTSKADGSLLCISAFTGVALQIVLPLVELFGSEYVRLWATQSLKLSCGKRLLVPGTQGTFMESGNMAPYMVTAMLIGSDITDRQSLTGCKNYLEAWSQFGERWMTRFFQFSFFDELTESHTFSFESICKDRCGLFGDRPHTELACSYPRDRLIFLGTSLSDKRFYIPHCLYDEMKWCVPFEQSLWWKVTHAQQVNDMLDDLEAMILNKLTKLEYLSKFQPNNNNFDIHSNSEVDNAIIDYEGWVAMKVASLPVTDAEHLQVYSQLAIPKTIYSKIKTKPYYKTHKFHAENIVYMTQLAVTAGHIFPLARKVAGLCAPGAMAERLAQAGVRTMQLLNFDRESDLMKMLRDSFAKEKEAAITATTKKVPVDPFDDKFHARKDIGIQCKIAFCRSKVIGQMLVPIYLELFPEIDPNTVALDHLVSSLTVELEPWNPGYDARANNLSVNSKSVQELVAACMGMKLGID